MQATRPRSFRPGYPRCVPEGHIAHRNAALFAATLVGTPLVAVEVAHPRLASQAIDRRLAGACVTAAEARGKHHLLRFDSGRVLCSHLMMSGIWRVLPAAAPLRRSGLYLALRTARHTAALYRCPTVRLLEPGQPLPGALAAVGPDLLDPAVDPTAAMDRGLLRAAGERQLGDALMDQRIVGGIGNVYKSETCFLCGLDPWRPIGGIDSTQRRLLGETAARLLADGVRDRGRIRTYRPPGAADHGEHTWVYGRRNLPCRRCATTIRSRGQGDANRTTYWCPTCQS